MTGHPMMSARIAIAVLAGLWLLAARPAAGQIYNWQTGQVIPGTESITPGPGIDVSYCNTDSRNLRYADLSGGLDLHDCRFLYSWLDLARFGGANLTGARFHSATLAGADLAGATVAWADFGDTTFRGFTREQLYSTASYQAGDLQGIGLSGNDLVGWNFANQNLTYANLQHATLTGADLGGANLTQASFLGATLTGANLAGATVTGANLQEATAKGFTREQLYSTASYQAGDLRGISLRGSDLTGWNLAGQNLAGADFWSATLTGADLRGANLAHAICPYATLTDGNLGGANLTGASFHSATLAGVDLAGATVTGVNFGGTASKGFTREQLYSTASYQAGNLQGIGLGSNDLTGWNFASQDLTNASFDYATLTGADLGGADLTRGFFPNATLTGANLRGADLTDANFSDATLTNADLSQADTRNATGLVWSTAITTNTILPDGHINGLSLPAGATMPIRDYDGNVAITIDSAMALAGGSTLDILLADSTWGSTITLASGVTPDLAGALRLGFAAGTDPLSLVGTTFNLFNWNGQLAAGDQFGQILTAPWAQWDLGNLYTTGEVTLIAVPEPATLGLLLAALCLRHRRRRP